MISITLGGIRGDPPPSHSLLIIWISSIGGTLSHVKEPHPRFRIDQCVAPPTPGALSAMNFAAKTLKIVFSNVIFGL
jgi:hypothetical protein